MSPADARLLSRELQERMQAVPGGEKLAQCLQCGTCSASCPSSAAMDYSPRAILAALRADRLEDVLRSKTAWLCASCYSCTVRCPAGVPYTDLMYTLKRLALERGVLPRKAPGAEMASAFTKTVNLYGRSAETSLMRTYFLRTGLWKAFRSLPLAWRLYRKGRLELRPRRIREIEGLRRMMAEADTRGSR
jgi:heterodisulfide reductase subunit C